MSRKAERYGLWLIGARGGVATTAILGLEAIRRGLSAPLGLIGHMPPYDQIGLSGLDAWVVGGHEIRTGSLEASARELHEGSGLFAPEMLAQCRNWLRACDRNIVPGTVAGCGPTIEAMATENAACARRSPAAWVEQLADDIRSFARRNRLARVVVLNVSSTEPPFRIARIHQSWSVLKNALYGKAAARMPASSLYALAAIEAGAAYINFTPSVGIDLPALRERANERGTSYMGADGKTGETLMKSVLAPMFPARNLQVLSWVGHNIFGNRDGVVLDDPINKAAKVKSKDHLVGEMLGYAPKTLVSIEYIESMQDWKTAWDHIHFAGFLGTKMALQFIWQGCDSILAAPLVIELARFAELAMRRGEGGPLLHLSSFFKSPMDARENAFMKQQLRLVAYARRILKEKGIAVPPIGMR